jgi:hypothetical protein
VTQALLIKWRCEKPRRELKVWFLDASKQIFGSAFAHLINLVLAIILTAAGAKGSGKHDECAWYFINYIVDVFIGMIIAFYLLKVLAVVSQRYNLTSLQHLGEYSADVDKTIHSSTANDLSKRVEAQRRKAEYGTHVKKIQLDIWGKQLCSWLLITAIVKVLCLILILIFLTPLSSLGTWIFSPLQDDPDAELLVVMIVTPVILNTLTFIVLDNFLMAKKGSGGAVDLEYEPLTSSRDEEEDENVMERL